MLTNRPSFFINYDPSLPIDFKIPFIREFALIYVSWYVALVVLPIAMFFINPQSYKKMLIGYFCTCMAACLLYVFIQADAKPLNENLVLKNDPFSFIMGKIFELGKNYNCLPSTHCMVSLVFAFYYAKEIKIQKITRILIVSWMLLICVSTVLVKQHYILDIPAALLFTIITISIIETVAHLKKKKAVI